MAVSSQIRKAAPVKNVSILSSPSSEPCPDRAPGGGVEREGLAIALRRVEPGQAVIAGSLTGALCPRGIMGSRRYTGGAWQSVGDDQGILSALGAACRERRRRIGSRARSE